MKIANVNGRAVLMTSDESGVDIAELSGGRYGPDLPALYESWGEFLQWARAAEMSDAPALGVQREQLGSPSPAPRQVVAVGLNYREHAAETGFALPGALPPTFTKFPSSITGPDTAVELPIGGHTDWEVELVLVIGTGGRRIRVEDAWSHVAGVTVGQDLSERITQMEGPAPQFSLGKSFPGFTPMGPWLVTAEELADPDDLELGCSIDGTVMQLGRTSDLIFPVAELVAKLSEVLTFVPGDVIFTGTPAGVGLGRSPQRFLQAGETLSTWIEGIGEIRQTFVAPTQASS
ncbi:fumarylacetoacetate hydrolase family protein [Glaciihabitans sp. UYNi722]|uniref:fumarylacetoacetate hydrolase family protein n=1 Tax=Glaciihabitans sp. UYNi722 TaxID=3156344 RepID=UPI003397F21F